MNAPKPCTNVDCRHPRRQHLQKTPKQNERGVDFHYGACRVPGCRCVQYYPPQERAA